MTAPLLRWRRQLAELVGAEAADTMLGSVVRRWSREGDGVMLRKAEELLKAHGIEPEAPR